MNSLKDVGCGAECNHINRSGWGSGPWIYEPDRDDFHYAGFPCVVHRGRGGHWCGYVGLPPAHPLYGKDYNAINVTVHGGLTYASKCSGHICHVANKNEPDIVWWFGFDCAHLGDLSPNSHRYRIRGDNMGETYKPMSYAKTETRRLAKQLAKLSTTPQEAAK